MTLSAADHIAIREVLADYGHVVDDHDWSRAEDVFTPDVVLETGPEGPTLLPQRGPADDR